MQFWILDWHHRTINSAFEVDSFSSSAARLKFCIMGGCLNSINDCPNSINDCPNSINDIPNSINDCPNSINDCPNSINDCPNSINDCPNSINDCPNSINDCPNSINNRILVLGFVPQTPLANLFLTETNYCVFSNI
ncbi:hypothetical protein NIES25_55720 (plasmid) [Nostoc linckia NIES-25]|nr:hypothetical protein NIES25_55720 [Nostoc linckia NIES-25]